MPQPHLANYPACFELAGWRGPWDRRERHQHPPRGWLGGCGGACPYPFCFRAPVKNGTSGVIFRQESRIVPGWASCSPGAGEALLGKQQMLLRLCYPCRGVTSTQDTGKMCLEFPRSTTLHKSAPGESSRLCRKLI